jgi:hypothetical protein
MRPHLSTEQVLAQSAQAFKNNPPGKAATARLAAGEAEMKKLPQEFMVSRKRRPRLDKTKNGECDVAE